MEIKEGGAIYVNGRYVESLLLNGKDFFKGNNNVMLNNLAAYTVKDIQVYDKRSDLGEFLGTESESQKEYVMDVKLKKDYNGGWMINAEGGYGTNDRYLGRLFVVNFNSRNRFTFIGNTNNLGSNERPGQDRGFNFLNNSNATQYGRSDLVDGGLDYYIERDKKKFTGNTYITSLYNNTTITTSSVNFLPQGNNYSYSRNKSKASNLKVDTWHLISNSSDYLYWQVTPSYHYANSDGSSAAAQALFNSELSGTQWTGLLGRLMSGDVTPEMRDSLINQSLRTSGNSSIRNHASTQAQAHIKFRGSSDYISSELNANYVYSHLYDHNRYLINYGDEAIPGLGQKQRTAERPDREYSIAAHAQYNYVVDSKTTLSLRYGFAEYWHDRSSNLYMAQIQAEATGRFDLLALEQMKETLDAANSFESHDHNSTHTIIPRFEKEMEVSSGKLRFKVEVPTNITTKRLHYTRGSVDVSPQRTWGLVDGNLLGLIFQKDTERAMHYYNIGYRLSSAAPDLERMIDMVNDADPLNIYLGNPDLKTSCTHGLALNTSHWIKSSQTSVYAYINGSYVQRAIVSGYALDPNTGVRRFKAYNVDGNWSLSGRGGFSTSLGSRKQWSPGVNVLATYQKYTDMIGLGVIEPEQSKSYALTLSLRPEVSYEAFGWQFNLGVSGQWTRSKNSGLYGTAPDNVGFVNPYFWAGGKLPANFRLMTNVQMYKRVGMSDSALNKPQWLWTMSLEYVPDKKWVISLDGFDILRQLSPAQVTVNSQGRVETYTNTLPSYFMARVQYHISISPKKEIVQPRYY